MCTCGLCVWCVWLCVCVRVWHVLWHVYVVCELQCRSSASPARSWWALRQPRSRCLLPQDSGRGPAVALLTQARGSWGLQDSASLSVP